MEGAYTKRRRLNFHTFSRFNATPPTSRPFSFFLSLPVEIRLHIYRYAFSFSSSNTDLIRVTVDKKPPRRPQVFRNNVNNSLPISLRCTRLPSIPLPAGLLRTNQQIYREALPILYASVTFVFFPNPNSLTYLFDRFSDHARNNIQYLQLYPAPLFKADNEKLSWAIVCAQVARLPSLKRVDVIYRRLEALKMDTVEYHYQRYGRWLAAIPADKEPVFEEQHATVAEMKECSRRFQDIVRGRIITI